MNGEISFGSPSVSATCKLSGCHRLTATKFAADTGDDADIKRREASIICKTTNEIKGVGFCNPTESYFVSFYATDTLFILHFEDWQCSCDVT